MAWPTLRQWTRRRTAEFASLLEVVIAGRNRTLAYRERDPRCVLVVVFETTPPFRGIEVRVDAALSSDGVAPTRPAIASRHPAPRTVGGR